MKFVVFLSLVAVALADFHNPDENENVKSEYLLEGDLRIKPHTRGSVDFAKRWRDGIMPYVFSSKFARYGTAVRVVKEAMRVWSMATCIKFVKRTTERDYVQFDIRNGCWSYLGRIGGMQRISMGSGCHYAGIAAHEIGHALGFYHEQSRPDRDNFVKIMTANIKQANAYNFRKHPSINTHGTPYDYGSVMHYGPYAFSKNRKATIVATKPGVYFGQRLGPSTIDIKEMRKFYQCKDAPFIEYATGCSFKFTVAAHRCWRRCNPKSPKKGDWCWTKKKCGKGFWSLGKEQCPGSVAFEKCYGKCG